MMECRIREALYLGENQWAVDSAVTDENGTRIGVVPVEAPEDAEDAVLIEAVIKAYGG